MSPRWDFYASQPHYGDHLLPIWRALRDDERGRFYCGGTVGTHLLSRGMTKTELGHGAPRRGDRTLVVASQGDSYRVRPRRCVLLEHGAGQVYIEPHGAYSGGPDRDNVVLFLCPNDAVAGRNRAAYPDAHVEVVGAPRLDELVSQARSGPQPQRDTVALSFHWDCPLSPEAGWALPHFKAALPAVARRWPTVGHGHPRFRGFFGQLWRDLRVDRVEHFADLVGRAWLYVCDNSSTLYEWATLGRPVVVLNSPAYRRDLDIWPRFWRCADVGIQCDDPDDLAAAVETALEDPPAVAARRAEVVAEVFPLQDGRAAERAVGALRAVG